MIENENQINDESRTNEIEIDLLAEIPEQQLNNIEVPGPKKKQTSKNVI